MPIRNVFKCWWAAFWRSFPSNPISPTLETCFFNSQKANCLIAISMYYPCQFRTILHYDFICYWKRRLVLRLTFLDCTVLERVVTSSCPLERTQKTIKRGGHRFSFRNASESVWLITRHTISSWCARLVCQSWILPTSAAAAAGQHLGFSFVTWLRYHCKPVA